MTTNKTNQITNTSEAVKANPGGYLAQAVTQGTNAFIHGMEAQGQRELCAQKTRLPFDMIVPDLLGLQHAGLKLTNGLQPCEDDPLFMEVVLPAGWKIVPTNHDMWSRLLDERDRIRAKIFYKAAFYDRRAKLHIQRRYNVEEFYADSGAGENAACVKDGETTLERFTYPQEDYTAAARARAEAERWLDNRFPLWRDPGAYWDA